MSASNNYRKAEKWIPTCQGKSINARMNTTTYADQQMSTWLDIEGHEQANINTQASAFDFDFAA